MKDESKAKWPDRMVPESGEPTREVVFVVSDDTFLLEIYGDDGKDVATARARQICALPAMVALLKEAVLIKEGDDYLAIVDKAKHILAQIGEIE